MEKATSINKANFLLGSGKVKNVIDSRINALELTRKTYLEKEDLKFAAQIWARLEELKALKKQFTDKNGNWII